MKTKTFVTVLFVLVGAAQIASSTYMLAKAWLSQVLIDQAWEKTKKDHQPHPPWSWADTYPMAILNFPRLQKKTFVLAGSSARNLAFSATHMRQSGLPGQEKSTLISGHNDSHFSFLQSLIVGDQIIVELMDASHKYCINSIQIINSKKQQLLIKNTDELILSTCYPFNSLTTGGSLRYVVFASPACNTLNPV